MQYHQTPMDPNHNSNKKQSFHIAGGERVGKLAGNDLTCTVTGTWPTQFSLPEEGGFPCQGCILVFKPFLIGTGNRIEGLHLNFDHVLS